MPWQETDAMDQRCRFVITYLSGQFEMSELCKDFGISRPTGYKWVERYRSKGAPGLQELSRAAHHCPHRMSAAAQRWLLAERRAHPSWGPRKLLKRFRDRCSSRNAPSRSAIAALLRRHGLSQPRKRRRVARAQGGARVLRVHQPNALWTIDFKGQFRLGDFRWCYPLTVMDSASRFLLDCDAQARISGNTVRERMKRLFQCYGLPHTIHSDNGSPFASSSPTGLSQLSVYWLKLGITLHRSRPGCPQDNGAHERMHRTLKAETARPPCSNLRAQQRRFRRFQSEYNQERPHEALNDLTPSQLYRPSLRPYPTRIEPPHYPGHFHVRRVRTDGSIKWLGRLLFVSSALCAERLGMEEVDDGLWSIWFMNHLLGRLDVRTMKIIYLQV
jgi:putative transposase